MPGMTNLRTWIYVALLGVAGIVGGLIVDASLHAADHTLAAREGIFTLTNPGHLLLALGVGLVTVAVGTLVVLTHLKPPAAAVSRRP